MTVRHRHASLLLASAISFAAIAAAQSVEKRALWIQPVEPFRIFGPPHYVGTQEIAAFAITTPEGLIVRDQLAGNPLYPEIAADECRTFTRLRGLPCDLFLGAHGSLLTWRKKPPGCVPATAARLSTGRATSPTSTE